MSTDMFKWHKIKFAIGIDARVTDLVNDIINLSMQCTDDASSDTEYETCTDTEYPTDNSHSACDESKMNSTSDETLAF